ncbi:MAG: hypothetical protein ABI273_07315, partial [Lacunisphaera sp.]
MAKFNSTEWDEIRKKFRHSIMADTSLVSLAQNLDTKEWPHEGEEEKPSKYIDFTYDELLMLPEIAGRAEQADHLISILKETLAFDDPFGDMVAQVEETAAKENPILKTLSRLSIPEDFPLLLANLGEDTRIVCASEGVTTIGAFANLGQQMSTRVVLGGDFRTALNALTHGDEEAISQFLPYRKGATGLHLPEAIGLVAASLPRSEQLSLGRHYGAKLTTTDAAVAKSISKDQVEKIENTLRVSVAAALTYFQAQKEALIAELSAGSSLERYFVVINDPAREAIAVRLTSGLVKANPKAPSVSVPTESKKKGFFS